MTAVSTTGVALPVPPGWIELKAYADDAEAAAGFDRMLGDTPGVDEVLAARLRKEFQRARAGVAASQVDSAGVLLTTTASEPTPDAIRDGLTVWAFTASVVVLPGPADLNPMAVIERYVGQHPWGADDELEPFSTLDGRDGVAIHTTLDAHADALPAWVAVDPDDGTPGGLVMAGVVLPSPDGVSRVLVTVGVCPTLEERPWLALQQAHLTVGARVVGEADEDHLGLVQQHGRP